MNSVLFICTANICRSPIAMGLLRAKVAGTGENWRIESAGTWAIDGAPAAVNSQLVLAEMGIDISNHRSRMVREKMLGEFNLILTMERGHKEALRIEFPQYRDRIYLLSEMVGGIFDIHDPIGRPLDEFRDTALEINQILDEGFERILELSAPDHN